MLSFLVRGLAGRWATVVTTVLALVFGVALAAAAGLVLAGTLTAPDRSPQRYAGAPVVVTPVGELRVPTVHGSRGRPLAEPGGVPADVLARVAALGPVVPDRIFYAQLAGGGPARTGRPWPVAAYGSYRLVAGRAPVDSAEIVVPAGAGATGDRVRVLTVDGPGDYVVVGVTAPVAYESVLFFSAAEAARLCPPVSALLTAAPADAVRPAVGGAARVRTGAARRALDPDLRRDTEALVAANSLVGTAGGIAAFVSVFVVASAFAYAVTRRRRELALLRTAGATPGQVRRLVLGEAVVLGVAASAAGCVLGRAGGPHLAGWLVEQGFAPPWFTVPAAGAPLVVAFAVGLGAALSGAGSAAWRAGRIRPVEALRETTVQARPMTVSRWVAAVGTGAGALALLALPVIAAPGDAIHRKHYLPTVMLLLVAGTLLAPVVVGPVARLVGAPLARARGATGLLVAQGARAAAGRTAATAAPVLLTVGLAAALFTTTATIDRARADAAARFGGDLHVVPAGAPGLNRAVVDRVRAVPGLTVTAVHPVTLYDLEERTALLRRAASAVDPAALAGGVLRLPVVAGNARDLRDDTIIVPQEWNRRVGDMVAVWLGDGTPARFRVVAVVRDGMGDGAYLTSRYATGLAERVQIGLGPATTRAAAVAALRAATDGLGAAVVGTGTGAPATRNRAAGAGLRVVLGLALLYALLSVAGTAVTAARDRAPELALLRLAGATGGQVLRAVAGEALFVVAVGVLLAAGVAALAVGGLWLALLRLVGPVPVVVGWGPVGVAVAACAVVALSATVLPTVPPRRRVSR